MDEIKKNNQDFHAQNITLFPFQEENAKRILQKYFTNNTSGLILAMDTGLGKTYTTLYIIAKIQEWERQNNLNLTKFTILTTSSMLEEWKACKKDIINNLQLKDDDITILKITSSKERLQKNFIEHNSLTPSLFNNKQEKTVHFIVVDESHKIKNFKSEIYNKFHKILPQNVFVLLLSATPATNCAKDFYTQLLVIKSKNLLEKYKTFEDFLEDFTERALLGIGDYKTLNPQANIVNIGFKNKEKFFKQFGDDIIYVNKEDLHENTIKIVNKIVYSKILPLADNEKQKQFREHQIEKLERIYILSTNEVIKRRIERMYDFMTFYRRVEILMSIYERIKHNSPEEKLVIFCMNIKLMEQLAKKLQSKNIETFVLNGKLSSKKRREAILKFNSIRNNAIIIISKAGSEGLNLQISNTMVFFDYVLDSNVFEQAKNRIHRIVQQRDCYYYILRFQTRRNVFNNCWDRTFKKENTRKNFLNGKSNKKNLNISIEQTNPFKKDNFDFITSQNQNQSLYCGNNTKLLLRPSGAKEWINCPFSACYTYTYNLDETEEHKAKMKPYNKRGQIIHSKAEELLKWALNKLEKGILYETIQKFIFQRLNQEHNSSVHNSLEVIQSCGYVLKILGNIANKFQQKRIKNITIEEKLDILDIQGDFDFLSISGSPDFCCFDETINQIQVYDLKTGSSAVSPHNNYQLLCYALGFYKKLKKEQNSLIVKTFKFSIIQRDLSASKFPSEKYEVISFDDFVKRVAFLQKSQEIIKNKLKEKNTIPAFLLELKEASTKNKIRDLAIKYAKPSNCFYCKAAQHNICDLKNYNDKYNNILDVFYQKD